MQSINIINLNLNKCKDIKSTINYYHQNYRYDLVFVSTKNKNTINEVINGFSKFKPFIEENKKPRILFYDVNRFTIIEAYHYQKDYFIKIIDNYNNQIFFIASCKRTGIFRNNNLKKFINLNHKINEYSGNIELPIIYNMFTDKANLVKLAPHLNEHNIKKTQVNTTTKINILMSNKFLSIKHYQLLNDGLIAELSFKS